MMKIEKNVDGSGFVLTNYAGDVLKVSFMEFWDICREGTRLDTRGEVEEYLAQLDEIGGYTLDTLPEFSSLIDQITEQVIGDRINNETGDQIYDATEKCVKEHMQKYEDLLTKAYAKYKEDWCRQRGVQVNDVDEEVGINGGECFVCLEEFETDEFQDRNYMASILSNDEFMQWHKMWDSNVTNLSRDSMPGSVVHVTVNDCFSGYVKVIENQGNKWFVEVVDVSMCYPQQVQSQPGERFWINEDELYKEENSLKATSLDEQISDAADKASKGVESGLYTCLADKGYAFLVRAVDVEDAEKTGLAWYTDAVFEPGHFDCWKTTKTDFNNYSELSLDDVVESDAYIKAKREQEILL